MESLLDQADALVRLSSSTDSPRPDFDIPECYNNISNNACVVLREAMPNKKGIGWFATRDIAAGTIVLVAKPLGIVMDWEVDSDPLLREKNDKDDDADEDDEDNEMEDDDDEEGEPRINELLLLQLLTKLADKEYGPTLWKDKLSTLFPRNDADLSTLPAGVCQNDDVFIQVEALLSSIERQHKGLPVKEISKRLPLIIRYNILSVETCSELLSYPGPDGHNVLAGVALYHEPSFFNHSHKPVVNRWAVGDIMFFVTNQNVTAGSELCISYIEHDVLCEPAFRRNAMMSMDFSDTDTDDSCSQDQQTLRNVEKEHDQADGPELPVVDTQVQNELMAMDPFSRLAAIEELMQQALGEKLPQDEVNEKLQGSKMDLSEHIPTWFQCDVQNLRILKAISLDGMGQTSNALRLWNDSIGFVMDKLPPADESLVVLHTQAALCALHANDVHQAREHAASALATHHLLFGGGIAIFRRRMERDFRLSLRPKSNIANRTQSPEEFLWPIM